MTTNEGRPTRNCVALDLFAPSHRSYYRRPKRRNATWSGYVAFIQKIALPDSAKLTNARDTTFLFGGN